MLEQLKGYQKSITLIKTALGTSTEPTKGQAQIIIMSYDIGVME